MRVLVLGASGMLGHKVWQSVQRPPFDSRAAVRSSPRRDTLALFPEDRVLAGYDLTHTSAVAELLEQTRPEVVINCAGVVKQVDQASDPVAQVEVNALLPHRLAALCEEYQCRLLHFSTDCVFSGERGAYREDDIPDARDLYGRAKMLGEVVGRRMLTIRSSIIGREIRTKHGLLEWFLSQRGGRVKGFRHAVFSGLTTIEMARLVVRTLMEWPTLEGLYHVASRPISKYNLLLKMRDILKVEIGIDKEDDTACDRSLDGRRFSAATGYESPSWDEMLHEVAIDPTPYDAWRTVE
jgi:dTDP-4-dehydrorhamnose reductase